MISFEVNGKKVAPDQLAKEMEKALVRETAEELEQQLAGMTCATHGKRPRIRAEQGASFDSLTFEVTACCDDLMERAQAVLGAK